MLAMLAVPIVVLGGLGAYMLYGAWQCARMGEGFLEKTVIALIVLIPPVAMLIIGACL
jgi:hypothetical protein